MLTPAVPSLNIDIDLLTADAATLAEELYQGRLTSVALVEKSLDVIRKNDGYLHAMLSLTPTDMLKELAETLDRERAKGILRGPLHGIPIVIKDNIATHPSLGLPTTCGSWALQKMRPRANAALVDQLIASGLIIIGKANLSEWSYNRSCTIPSGWSGIGGQCQSAYVRGGVDPDDSLDGHSNPSGSSTGSAVAVSAGYAPLSIGTETDGSLVAPASRAALYTIKPTMGLVSQHGIIPISHTMDSAGPMAKTPLDLAVLLDVIRQPGPVGNNSFVQSLHGDWDDMSIGALDYHEWWPSADQVKPVDSATKQMHAEIQAVYDKMRGLARKFVSNVPLVTPDALMLGGKSSKSTIAMADFKQDLVSFLKSTEYCPVRSIRELIDFNIKHAELEMPHGYDQQVFFDVDNLEITPEEYQKHFSHMRKVARDDGLDRIFTQQGVDLIIGPGDSSMRSMASTSGYPIGSVPLGYLDYNGRPFGLHVIAGKNEDAKILRFMQIWDSTFGPRKPPPMLQKGFE